MHDQSDLPAHLVATAREYIAGATWTYAKTMPENPHWYTVITHATDHRIDALLTLLLQHSHVRRWHGQPYRTMTLDGWDYWDIEPVINRKPTEFAGWDGDPAPPRNWLSDSYRRDMRGDEEIGQAERFRWRADDVQMLEESGNSGADPDGRIEP